MVESRRDLERVESRGGATGRPVECRVRRESPLHGGEALGASDEDQPSGSVDDAEHDAVGGVGAAGGVELVEEVETLRLGDTADGEHRRVF